MALYYDLPVYQAVYRLILKLFEITRDFPREYKYTLGEELKRDGIVLVRRIYLADKAKNEAQYVERFLDDFEVLSMKKQGELSALMDGIGRLITGWPNSSR